MAHHSHHHHDHGQSPTPRTIIRPALLRYLSSLALILPPVLYLISMSLGLAIQYNEHYALATIANSAGLPSGALVSASPFYLCGSLPTQSIDDPSTFNWKCSRQPLIAKGAMQKCYERFLPGWDDVQICQKVVSSAALYVAGTVLVGVSILGAIAVLGLDFKRAWSTLEYPEGYEYTAVSHAAPKDNEPSSASSSSTSNGPYTTIRILTSTVFSATTLLALLGAGCFIFAQILGVQSLVNEQHPTAGETPGDGLIGRWYMGKPAFQWSIVAWLSALIGVFIAVAGRGGSK